jgi:hypothetical protein
MTQEPENDMEFERLAFTVLRDDHMREESLVCVTRGGRLFYEKWLNSTELYELRRQIDANNSIIDFKS